MPLGPTAAARKMMREVAKEEIAKVFGAKKAQKTGGGRRRGRAGRKPAASKE